MMHFRVIYSYSLAKKMPPLYSREGKQTIDQTVCVLFNGIFK